MLHDSDNAFKLGNRLRILWLQSERFEKTEILRQIQKEYGKLLSLHATLDRLEQQAKGEPSDKGEENETAPREAIAKEMAEIIAEIRGWPTLYLIQQG